MKRFLVILFVLLLVLAVAAPAIADHGGPPCQEGTGVGATDYALHHILAATAQGSHVPGTHMGYSLCLGVHG